MYTVFQLLPSLDCRVHALSHHCTHHTVYNCPTHNSYLSYLRHFSKHAIEYTIIDTSSSYQYISQFTYYIFHLFNIINFPSSDLQYYSSHLHVSCCSSVLSQLYIVRLDFITVGNICVTHFMYILHIRTMCQIQPLNNLLCVTHIYARTYSTVYNVQVFSTMYFWRLQT